MENKNQKTQQTTLEKNKNTSSSENDLQKCDVCGEYHEKSITHGFSVKGKKKYICQECADSVHGLV